MIRQVLIRTIGCYQRFLSPFLGRSCRFYPSCSTYTHKALEKYGVVKGCRLGLQRILRCHPWHPGGFDPLP